MSTIDTFDWYKDEAWHALSEEGKRYLESQRRFLLTLRNEDERRRLLTEVMETINAMKGQRRH
jgi:hypothetical protein